jgi:hypothetical protein
VQYYSYRIAGGDPGGEFLKLAAKIKFGISSTPIETTLRIKIKTIVLEIIFPVAT